MLTPENTMTNQNELTLQTVQSVFSSYNLGEVKTVKKVDVGFSNKIYIINGTHILKVCEYEDNEQHFEKEVYLYNLFKGKLPIPEIIAFDKSKKLINKHFMIYPMIQGDNLYSCWHEYTDEQRKSVLGSLVDCLMQINRIPLNSLNQEHGLNQNLNWQEHILGKINSSLEEIEKRNLLTPELLQKVKDFVGENKDCLTEEKLALVNWDTHFDNVLVKDGKLVGLLDFERTEIASIDFCLNMFRRMTDYPKKYMAEKYERFAKPEDYSKLFDWLKEFYPELFNFKDLELRLRLYALNQDLRDLTMWPDSTSLREMIEKDISI